MSERRPAAICARPSSLAPVTMLANNNVVADALNEPELSVVPESPLAVTPPMSNVSNTYNRTPRPAGAVRAVARDTHEVTRACAGVVKASRPLQLHHRACRSVRITTMTLGSSMRARAVKLEDILPVVVAASACSVSMPEHGAGGGVVDPVSKPMKQTCDASVAEPAETLGEMSARAHAPADAADPMPSLWVFVPHSMLHRVPKKIPNYFLEAVSYWYADYNRLVFMEYAARAPHKLRLGQCEQLWREYESYWHEAYGGSDWRDSDINDISSFDAVPVPDDEPVATVVLMVNRYIAYLAARDAYNRRYFLSPGSEASE